MDACRGKNCRMKDIHSTYSSCHRWWNKICRQLICVTNCGCLVFEFKVFAAEVEPLSRVAPCGFVNPGPVKIHTCDLLLHGRCMCSHQHLSSRMLCTPRLPFCRNPLWTAKAAVPLPAEWNPKAWAGAAGLPPAGRAVPWAREGPAECRGWRHHYRWRDELCMDSFTFVRSGRM